MVFIASPQLLDFIKRHEGVRYEAYRDVGNLWTIGAGHLIRSNEQYLLHETINDDKVDALLSKDLTDVMTCLQRHLVVDLPQNQLDALVALVFNIGTSAFISSTILQLVNAKSPMEDIAHQFTRWNKVKGKVCDGLTNRRSAEIAVYLDNDYTK